MITELIASTKNATVNKNGKVREMIIVTTPTGAVAGDCVTGGTASDTATNYATNQVAGITPSCVLRFKF